MIGIVNFKCPVCDQRRLTLAVKVPGWNGRVTWFESGSSGGRGWAATHQYDFKIVNCDDCGLLRWGIPTDVDIGWRRLTMGGLVDD